jgi:hypothetical protein
MADNTSAVLRWSARSETVGTPIGLHCYPTTHNDVGDVVATLVFLRKVNALG